MIYKEKVCKCPILSQNKKLQSACLLIQYIDAQIWYIKFSENAENKSYTYLVQT